MTSSATCAWRGGRGRIRRSSVSVQVGKHTVFGGESVPVNATIRSVKDSGVNVNEVSFRALGQNYTLSQSDMIQRARDMAVNDPETVANNRVLSDLADGIGVVAAMTDPANSTRLPGFAITNNDINDALVALVTPPVPEHNPFVPPDPERNPFAPPPLPERAPQDETLPLPERRADDLTLDPEQQSALADDDPGMFTEASFDPQSGDENAPATEALSDPLGDTTPTESPSIMPTDTDDTYCGYAPSGDYSTDTTGTETGTQAPATTTTDTYGGYAPSGGDYGSYSSSETGTDSSTTDTSTTSYGSDTSTTSFGGDGSTTSYGGDTSTSYGGGDSGMSSSSDSSSTSAGGGF